VESLAHAAGVALHPLLLASVEADQLEQLADPRALPLRLDPVQLCEVAQVVEGGQTLVEASVATEDVADPLPHPAGVLDHVAAEHARLPRRRDQQRDQHLDRRRLPGPVRPEETEELTLLDREADAPDGLDLERAPAERTGGRPVRPVQVDGLDDGGHLGLHASGAVARLRGGNPNLAGGIDMSRAPLRECRFCGRTCGSQHRS
jgi:hypothetical protein